MISISISDRLKNKCPNIALGIIDFKCIVSEKNEQFWDLFISCISKLQLEIKDKSIKEIEEILSGRNAYKILGRDPDRYALSSEALLKRVKSGKDMYQINSLVDINNFISLNYFYSLGLYDLDKVAGDVLFDFGNTNEQYESLAKGLFDVTNLPIFRDSISGFGSPTSDSKRTCITLETTKASMIIISFNGQEKLSACIAFSIDILIKYAKVREIQSKIIV